MLKYVDYQIGFSEIPDEVSLCISLSNCGRHCKGCHSPQLQEDIGEALTKEVLHDLIEKHEGITCVCLLGGSKDLVSLNDLIGYCKSEYPNLKRAVYLGDNVFPYTLNLKLYNYIKLGHYDENKGGLNNPNTNQRLFKIVIDKGGLRVEDLTHKFWK